MNPSIDLSTLPITHSAPILPEYMDVMGHMNVMWYTHLFDKSIFGTFDLVGLDFESMKANQSGGFALETHIRYLAEIRTGQTVTIRTRLLGRTAKRFHLMSFMTNDKRNNALSATFELVGAHINMQSRRMSPMPDSVCAKLDELIETHQKLPWKPPVCKSMHP